MKKNLEKTISKKKSALIVAALLAGITSFPSFATAAVSPFIATRPLYQDGPEFGMIYFLRKGYSMGNETSQLTKPSKYNISNLLVNGTVSSALYWSDMLKPGSKNKGIWQIFVNTDYNDNAGAESQAMTSDGETIKFIDGAHYVKNLIQDGMTLNTITYEGAAEGEYPEGDYAYSGINIGTYMGAYRQGASYGWWVDADAILPTNEQAADFVGTIRHELGHALGITALTTSDEAKPSFINDIQDKNSWTLRLQDQNGNAAKPGMRIVTTEQFNELKDHDASLKPSDFFIVDKDFTSSGKGFSYFVGPTVLEVLDGATFFGRHALPVNGWEKNKFEGSHLENAGMMSHRDYTNYTTFLEAELAVMQDLGYNIDRKAYYGRSIYVEGKEINNTQGYFARNSTGTAYLNNTYSQVDLGVGLHIYGSKNTVNQAANILTKGVGAAGIRVDGVQNHVNIPENTVISADGDRGNGVIIAYGCDHILNQAGTVTARGKDGIGVRFDFGSSSNGARDEYRGSYIRYLRSVNINNGNITTGENLNLTEMDVKAYNTFYDELKGALVDEYNLSGTLVGAGNAIYIGKNAFVKNININDGASITGNITSDWKQFSDESCDGSYDGGNDGQPLKIQYNGKVEENGYDYDKYIPDLVTKLNFNTTMKYNGNIYGEDNMKLAVNKGELTYTGLAKVVNVEVAKDASLFGGEFTLQDMTAKLAPGFTDTTTGKFINHGTIGPEDGNNNMLINGNLVSDGVLSAYSGGDRGFIEVSGTADVDGSVVSLANALPGEEMEVISATQIKGTINNPEGKPYAATGLLNTTGSKDGNTIKVLATASNNLDGANAQQLETFAAMNTMAADLQESKDARADQLRRLYSLNSEAAGEALDAISSNAAANMVSLAQRNTMTGHIISARLTEAFARKPMDVQLPSSNLDDKGDNSVKLSMKLDQPVDNDFWIKTARNWGTGAFDAYYQGTTFSGGWDRAFGKSWRAGAFVSHGGISFADDNAHSCLKDTRFGLYGGYSRGAHSGYVYLDYGWLKNDLTRNLTGLNLRAEANYGSRLLELGGEYKYDMTAKKMPIWHISPYVNMQMSRLWQSGYTESGAGIFNHQLGAQANNYFAGGLGLEFKRYLDRGSFAFRLGAKHAFAGANPTLTFGYEGDTTNSYVVRGQQDRTHWVVSLAGETEFASGWTLAGDLALHRGHHDRDIMAAVTLRRMW